MERSISYNKNRNNNERSNSNCSSLREMNRPKSSNSMSRMLNESQENSRQKNLNQPEGGNGTQIMDQLNNAIHTKDTLFIDLDDQLFKNMSWASSFDFIESKSRDILGLVPVRSNLIWRYFLSMLKQRSNIKQHREKRCQELKILLSKLEQHLTDEGKSKKHKQIQEIYDKLKQVQTNGNPLTNMMTRNLKMFIKIYAEVRRKSRIELENFTQAILMDKKIEDIEKQNLESRVLILGCYKPNQFFNTHARVYDKVQISSNFAFTHAPQPPTGQN